MDKFVLLADDDIDDAELFHYVLKKVAATTKFQHVENGHLLFTSLTSSTMMPDIIFLDVNMPVMDGFKCLEQLKTQEAFKHIDVYMYSTSSNEKDRRKATEMGAVDFVTKPANLDKLEVILADIVLS